MLAMHRTEPSSASVPLLGYVRASKESKLQNTSESEERLQVIAKDAKVDNT